MPLAADEGLSVLAPSAGRIASAVGSPAMDGPEARGGEGQQNGRMVPDGLGHPLAASEAGCHEGEGVAPVEGGTGRADRLPARTTGLQQHAVGQPRGVESDLRHPTGSAVMTQPDRRIGRRQPRTARTWVVKSSTPPGR